jgi:hypothetical protein
MGRKNTENMTTTCETKVQKLIGKHALAYNIISCCEGEASKQADRQHEGYKKVTPFHSVHKLAGCFRTGNRVETVF